MKPGRHDTGARRQTKRSGRQRGVWLYLSGEQLELAGLDPTAPAPEYRVWASRSKGAGRFVVTLYPAEGS